MTHETELEAPEAALLARLEGWTIEAEPIEKRSDEAQVGDRWSKGACHFRVTLRPPGSAVWDGEYSAGAAHPLLAAKRAAEGTEEDWRAWSKVARGSGWPWPKRADCRTLNPYGMGRGRTVYEADIEEACRRAYRPSLVDVVGCLFCDASGVDELATFRDWSEEWGGEGNPADLLDSFHACQKAARFLRLAFGAEFEKAAEEAAEL